MSWPSDGLPRFRVVSVTGYSGDGGEGAKLATTFQVLDVPYCYELVFETPQRASAERCARAMNAGDLDYPQRRRAGNAWRRAYRERFPRVRRA